MTQKTPIETVISEIDKVAKITDRKAGDIELIAISKTRAAEDIRPLLAAGHRAFGENRVQEAQGKWPELRAEFPEVELHMVGQLQSNKAGDAVALFDYIHSLDRPSLLKALAKAMRAQGKSVPCFIQVDIGEEPQKGGCAIADLPDFAKRARDAGVDVIGLMCVPPANTEPAPYFALLAKLNRELGLSKLSMGMSGDYPTAIKLGATHIRVGTALFGARD